MLKKQREAVSKSKDSMQCAAKIQHQKRNEAAAEILERIQPRMYILVAFFNNSVTKTSPLTASIRTKDVLF